MIRKEYVENVLRKQSTHANVKEYRVAGNILIYDLVRIENDVEEYLATDRYCSKDEEDFGLTEEELQELQNGND